MQIDIETSIIYIDEVSKKFVRVYILRSCKLQYFIDLKNIIYKL